MSAVSVSIRVRLCIEDILRKRLPLFDGVDALLRLAAQVSALDRDRDLRLLTELIAQAEHLPIGAARAHWQSDALHRYDRELLELERRHEDAVFYACRRLIQTLDSLDAEAGPR